MAVETEIDTRNITLYDLAEYEEYCVVVSGGTYVGFGPYGQQHCAFTQEDSKYSSIISYVGFGPYGTQHCAFTQEDSKYSFIHNLSNRPHYNYLGENFCLPRCNNESPR